LAKNSLTPPGAGGNGRGEVVSLLVLLTDPDGVTLGTLAICEEEGGGRKGPTLAKGELIIVDEEEAKESFTKTSPATRNPICGLARLP
jgi:hypothetical protein